MFLSTAQMRKVSKPQHDIHLRIFNEDVYHWRRWIHVRPTSRREKMWLNQGDALLLPLLFDVVKRRPRLTLSVQWQSISLSSLR
ncbi:hypothetical protein Q8A67_023380 [Cirrhinus molitorella]|uniref:Uncharacterized protein n=1 Tax=Cirrhinus molitorella TaxID=172907 RepID=A0AA88P5Z8_9TELE|nr:hypothetical protein Q8A67_023380 [Cirrhinus molitorella]